VSFLRRFTRFNAVGILTLAAKLSVMAALREGGLHYLWATALATEVAILHGFLWHHHWTWRDRGRSDLLRRLVQYNAGNGALAIAVNLAVMRALTGWLGLHYLPAVAAATAVAGAANYFLSDLVIWRANGRNGTQYRRSGAPA
jgi:putative flippase GtrA